MHVRTQCAFLTHTLSVSLPLSLSFAPRHSFTCQHTAIKSQATTTSIVVMSQCNAGEAADSSQILGDFHDNDNADENHNDDENLRFQDILSINDNNDDDFHFHGIPSTSAPTTIVENLLQDNNVPRNPAWLETAHPDIMSVELDLVDRHMHYAATRENHVILQKCMQLLYPHWEHGKKNTLRSTIDDARKIRDLEHMGIAEVLQLLFTWDNFGRHIWAQVKHSAPRLGLVMKDVVRFMKTLCLILCYGVSIEKYFRNHGKIFKFLDPNDSLSEIKFRAFIEAFKPREKGDKARVQLNAFLSASRKCWGGLFFSNEHGIYSTDDDKQKARSLAAQNEGFIRKVRPNCIYLENHMCSKHLY